MNTRKHQALVSTHYKLLREMVSGFIVIDLRREFLLNLQDWNLSRGLKPSYFNLLQVQCPVWWRRRKRILTRLTEETSSLQPPPQSSTFSNCFLKPKYEPISSKTINLMNQLSYVYFYFKPSNLLPTLIHLLLF